VSIPKNTIDAKKINIHKLAKGRIANAFGNTLKLNYGPDKLIF